jgi:small subunit ribosomal protein S6
MQNPNTYEAALIFRPDQDEETVGAAVERLCQMIRDGGGKPGEPDKWGRRHLAYEIDGARDGIYVILPFEAPQSVPATLSRHLRISEDVLRFLVVHPPTPSPGRRTAAEGPGDPSAAPAPPSATVASFAPSGQRGGLRPLPETAPPRPARPTTAAAAEGAEAPAPTAEPEPAAVAQDAGASGNEGDKGAVEPGS